jgi:hypothetical protein
LETGQDAVRTKEHRWSARTSNLTQVSSLSHPALARAPAKPLTLFAASIKKAREGTQ